jgi:GntR family transcriptional regulator, transcriptional repressor for pyruvate dehydrogenase complex
MPITLQRRTLADQVAEHLLQRIEHQVLPAGTPLPSEAQLAAEFGVSRPVVREALRALEAIGVVDVANGKRAIVRPLSGEPLSVFFQRVARLRQGALVELLEVRKGIEIESATLAARRHTVEEAAELRRIVAEMREHLHEPERYTQLDVTLHLRVARASRNLVLFHLVESIRDPLQETIREGLHRRINDEQIERVQELHEQLVEAITTGSAVEAGRAMADHFDEAVMAMVQGKHDVGDRAPGWPSG